MLKDRLNAKRMAPLLLSMLTAAALAGTSPANPASAQEPARPNILIIMTDDQPDRWAGMEVMPSISEIFERGGRHYKNAVATTPLCCPSRASIFSGKYAHNHGVHSNSDAENFNADESMQAVLKNSGYQTGYSGKYLNLEPHDLPQGDPPHFDYWSIMRGGHVYYNTEMNVNGEQRLIEDYSTDFIGKKAIDFLDRFELADSDPWFMVVAPYAPHRPATPEPKYETSKVPRWDPNPATEEDTVAELRDKPDYVLKMQSPERRAKRFRRRMLRTLKSVDDMVAKLFRKLKDRHEAGDTLAIFMTDNGYVLGEHGLLTKRFPYHPSVRIPLYLRWPGHVSRGAVSGKIVANIDIAPTVFEAAGATPPYPVDGRPLINGGRRDRILIESWFGADVPEWRGLWTPGNTYVEYGTGETEYYDDADRWQLVNRLGNSRTNDDPSNQPQLSALLNAYATCIGVTCP